MDRRLGGRHERVHEFSRDDLTQQNAELRGQMQLMAAQHEGMCEEVPRDRIRTRAIPHLF